MTINLYDIMLKSKTFLILVKCTTYKRENFSHTAQWKIRNKMQKIIKENYMICSQKVVVRWLSGGFN